MVRRKLDVFVDKFPRYLPGADAPTHVGTSGSWTAAISQLGWLTICLIKCEGDLAFRRQSCESRAVSESSIVILRCAAAKFRTR
jgi:hypothetical protein